MSRIQHAKEELASRSHHRLNDIKIINKELSLHPCVRLRYRDLSAVMLSAIMSSGALIAMLLSNVRAVHLEEADR